MGWDAKGGGAPAKAGIVLNIANGNSIELSLEILMAYLNSTRCRQGMQSVVVRDRLFCCQASRKALSARPLAAPRKSSVDALARLLKGNI